MNDSSSGHSRWQAIVSAFVVSWIVLGSSFLYTQGAKGFSAGVASGEVTATSAVLWTRTDNEGIVQLQVSTEAALQGRDTIEETVLASQATDLTVKVTVTGLLPATTYYYRWRQGTLASDTGTFRTAPLQNASSTVRFGFTGDSDGTSFNGVPAFNNFEVLDAVRAQHPDFFVYLGDTIYADSDWRGAPAETVDEFREAYKVNRRIRALPDLLKSLSTYATWDDHEVTNDYDGKTVNPNLYRTARQAFFEYMPLLDSGLPVDPQCAGDPLFRVFHWGRDVDIIMLDTRSCRSPRVEAECKLVAGISDPAPTLPAPLRVSLALPPEPPSRCLSAITDPSRTMLGSVQKQRFKSALIGSTAKFKFVISQVPIQQFYALPYDRWEGYAAERNEILNFIRSNHVANVVFLSADIHANLINEVFIDRFRDRATIAQEFVTGPVAEDTCRPVLRRKILGHCRWSD